MQQQTQACVDPTLVVNKGSRFGNRYTLNNKLLASVYHTNQKFTLSVSYQQVHLGIDTLRWLIVDRESSRSGKRWCKQQKVLERLESRDV